MRSACAACWNKRISNQPRLFGISTQTRATNTLLPKQDSLSRFFGREFGGNKAATVVRAVTERAASALTATTKCNGWLARGYYKRCAFMIDDRDGTFDKKRAIGARANRNIGHRDGFPG